MIFPAIASQNVAWNSSHLCMPIALGVVQKKFGVSSNLFF